MKINIKIKLILILLVLFSGTQSFSAYTDLIKKVKVGADLLFERQLSLLKGKNIGIVTNHSAILSDGRHLVDALNSIPDIKIKVLFGPEHGIRGDAPDGAKVDNDIDAKTNIKIFSLYGKVNKPTPEMLKDVDVLIFDIQDIGARFYTFTSTLFLCMEAAAEQKIDFIVLDRPNPIGGNHFDGPILEDSLKSFVGLKPIPIMHGMTVGELATMANEEGWLKDGIKAKLTVIKMENWSRDKWYDNTGLKWVKPSPNMATLSTATVYPGLCLIEGTNVSEGRGTDMPFEKIGAPFIKSNDFAQALNSCKLKGVKFHPIEFTPKNITRVTTDPKYESKQCYGIKIEVLNREIFEPVKAIIYILSNLKTLYPNDFKWRDPPRSTSKYFVDLLSGTKNIRLMLDKGLAPDKIMNSWKDGLKKYEITRKKYLLYD